MYYIVKGSLGSDLPVSASWVVELQICATMPGCEKKIWGLKQNEHNSDKSGPHPQQHTRGFWFSAYKKHSSSQFPRYLSHSMPMIRKAVMSSMTDTFNNLNQSPIKLAQSDLQKTWDSIFPKAKNDQLPSPVTVISSYFNKAYCYSYNLSLDSLSTL